jgi:hypothetical protein
LGFRPQFWWWRAFSWQSCRFTTIFFDPNLGQLVGVSVVIVFAFI